MASPNKKARLGFIGAGWWATANHMPVLSERDDVDFAGVCRLGKEELARVKERFGFDYATEDYRDLLENCELDGVIVASPHIKHAEHASAALERGLHVMCEKPMTIHAADARQLVSAAAEKGLHLMVPYGWHYKPFIQEAKSLIDDGRLGPIEYVLCHMASPIRSLLDGRGMMVPDGGGQSGETLFEPTTATWADPKAAAGGYGYAQLPHALGMLFWLSNLEARSVFSLMTAPGSKVDLYDAITVRFTNGAIGTVSGAANVPFDRPFHVDLRLFGPEGMLLLDCERARLELRRYDGDHVVADVDPDSGGYECSGPLYNFVDLILGKTETNSAPGLAGMRAIELLDAAYRSNASGVEEQV